MIPSKKLANRVKAGYETRRPKVDGMEACVSVVWCSGVQIVVGKQPQGGELESRRNCKRDVVTSIRSCGNTSVDYVATQLKRNGCWYVRICRKISIDVFRPNNDRSTSNRQDQQR